MATMRTDDGWPPRPAVSGAGRAGGASGVTTKPMEGDTLKKCATCGMTLDSNPAHDPAYEGVGAHKFKRVAAKSANVATNILIAPGGAIKSLGDNPATGNLRFEGWLVQYDTADLVNDVFQKSTQFFVEDGAIIPVLYDHGLNPTIKRRKIGRGKVVYKDAGLWLEGELERRDDYEKAIAELVINQKSGLSSGAAQHMVSRKTLDAAKGLQGIEEWGIAEASVTITPTERLNTLSAVKSLAEYALLRQDPFVTVKGGPGSGPHKKEGGEENSDRSLIRESTRQQLENRMSDHQKEIRSSMRGVSKGDKLIITDKDGDKHKVTALETARDIGMGSSPHYTLRVQHDDPEWEGATRQLETQHSDWIDKIEHDKSSKSLKTIKKEERDGETRYVLYTADGSKELGEHDTMAEAAAQERAIQTAKNKKAVVEGDEPHKFVPAEEDPDECFVCGEELEEGFHSNIPVKGGPGSGPHKKEGGDEGPIDTKTGRTWVNPTAMTSAGFKLAETKETDDATLRFYTHPDISDHHFLIRDDKPGILIGTGKPGSGIDTTVQNITAAKNYLQNYTKKSLKGGTGSGKSADEHPYKVVQKSEDGDQTVSTHEDAPAAKSAAQRGMEDTGDEHHVVHRPTGDVVSRVKPQGARKSVDVSRPMKSLFTEKLAQRSESVWQVRAALDEVFGDIATAASVEDVTGAPVDVQQKVVEAVTEYAGRLVQMATQQINEWKDQIENPSSSAISSCGGGPSRFYLRSLDTDFKGTLDTFMQLKGGLAHSLTLDRHSQEMVNVCGELATVTDALAAAMKVYNERVANKIKFRAADPARKAGRVLSAATSDKLQTVHGHMGKAITAMTEAHAHLGELMTKAKHKDGADNGTVNDDTDAPTGELLMARMKSAATLALIELDAAELENVAVN